MRAWLGRNKFWFAFVSVSILFTLGMVGALRLIFENAMFGVTLELPENITEAEIAEIEADMRNGTITVVQGSIVVVIGSMVVAHLWKRRSEK